MVKTTELYELRYDVTLNIKVTKKELILLARYAGANPPLKEAEEERAHEILEEKLYAKHPDAQGMYIDGYFFESALEDAGLPLKAYQIESLELDC